MRASRYALGWLGFAVAAGCVAPVAPGKTFNLGTSDHYQVAIVRSSANPVFEIPLRRFINDVDASIAVYTLSDYANPMGVIKDIEVRRPELVFVLGSQALVLARDNLGTMPVIFAMVVNSSRFGLESYPNISGIGLETPPLVEFTQFKMVAPGMKKLLTFYNATNSTGTIASARSALAQLGIDLVAVEVSTAEEVVGAYATHKAGVDSVWLGPEPLVMNPTTFAFLREQTRRDKILLVASLSSQFTRQGALMSVSVDTNNVGGQAAVMAQRALAGEMLPQGFGVVPPIGGELVVNVAVAKLIGITIPDTVYPFINEIIAVDYKSAAGTEAGPPKLAPPR